ncbi:MAG: GNAT family N-acetyltransferase [Oscillospiraceae bacterium]|jgi:GNAT superfamily N-acetyltransferase|nr:GNAT family N-acetyltransferase [Oscillospiraceae bacterium]
MSVNFRTYQNDTRFGRDYNAVRNFLLKLDSHNYSFGRWDWMITHSMLDETGLEKIGLWEEDGVVVGLATYDTMLGSAYVMTLDGFSDLKGEMLLYAKKALYKEGAFGFVIADSDRYMQRVAAGLGFRPSQNKECDAVLSLDTADFLYTLPDGFRVVGMDEELDYYKYGQVLWKGFNHEANGEGPFQCSDEDRLIYEREFKRPNLNLSLKIAVAAPNGDFVSYCGMWRDAASQNALVEPVATDPAYRKMGLGRAAVLEACRRCRDLGAKQAFVGSSQQFYYSIGFWPYATSTVWTEA